MGVSLSLKGVLECLHQLLHFISCRRHLPFQVLLLFLGKLHLIAQIIPDTPLTLLLFFFVLITLDVFLFIRGRSLKTTYPISILALENSYEA